MKENNTKAEKKYIFDADPYLLPFKEKILERHERIEACR